MTALRIGFLIALASLTLACGTATAPEDAASSADAASALDTSRPVDASGAGNGVHCLGVPGNQCAAGQICCGGSSAITCESSAATCTGAALACDGTEDCPGALCCSTATGSSCSATCSGYHLCHDASECAPGESCCPNGGGVPQGALDHCLALAAGQTCPLPP